MTSKSIQIFWSQKVTATSTFTKELNSFIIWFCEKHSINTLSLERYNNNWTFYIWNSVYIMLVDIVACCSSLKMLVSSNINYRYEGLFKSQMNQKLTGIFGHRGFSVHSRSYTQSSLSSETNRLRPLRFDVPCSVRKSWFLHFSLLCEVYKLIYSCLFICIFLSINSFRS